MPAAYIEFIIGVPEPCIPDVKLTRSRDGSTGVATFTFDNPSFLAAASAELGETTGARAALRRPCQLPCANRRARSCAQACTSRTTRAHSRPRRCAAATCPPRGARSRRPPQLHARLTPRLRTCAASGDGKLHQRQAAHRQGRGGDEDRGRVGPLHALHGAIRPGQRPRLRQGMRHESTQGAAGRSRAQGAGRRALPRATKGSFVWGGTTCTRPVHAHLCYLGSRV